MKRILKILLALVVMPSALLAIAREESNGLAPEVVELSPKSVSWAAEKLLPDLAQPYISTAPADLKDGIPVGKLENKEAMLKFTDEIADGQHGEIDSLLVAHHGRLLFESYYRRGRINYPHFQMSITKSYTALAIGRAIQLGHLTMADLDRPVVGFLKQLDRSKLVAGADAITLAEAMNMRSGVRLGDAKAKLLLKQPDALKGQGQIQAYLEHSAPIPKAPREYKYQEADPSMTMQVLDAVVPGGARKFIEKELFGKMGISNFAWENDISGLPKAAAGSGVRSRDMLKWGLLVLNGGVWNGEQLIPKVFVEQATSRIYTNKQDTSYGFFWWRQKVEAGGKTYDQKSGRGAGGQFIQMYPELDLIIVITAHQEGMGKMLTTAPARILPAFSATSGQSQNATRSDAAPDGKEFEKLFHTTLDFYGKLQRTPNGLYRDAYSINGSSRPNNFCSTAATGVGLMALCMEHALGRDSAAGQKALQTLRAINGKTAGFKMGREKAGFFQHFFSSEDGSGTSQYSTIDTAIMVVGALYCRNTFDDPQIKAEADQLWNSTDWSVALADPTGRQLHMVVVDGKPLENKKTFLFNEYYILAWFIREAQIQKTGHSAVITFQALNTWDNRGLKLLCANGPWPQCSFLIQFPFYMCHPCATDPLYREFVVAQAKADQRDCAKRTGVAEFWGCGAGGTPGGKYRASHYAKNPDNVVSPHIIAGFIPVSPMAQEHLLKLYRDPQRRVPSPVGDLLPRFSVDKPEWHAARIESIDYASMLFGLAGIHPQLGMTFFADKTKFTFNRKD